MGNNQNSFLGFIKQNRYLLLIVIIVLIVTYGYSLITADDLSIDEEGFFLTNTINQAKVPASFGRYGISLINILLLPKFNDLPYFNMLMAVGLMGLSALLLCYLITQIIKSVKIPPIAFIFLSVAMISFPSNLDALNFNTINIQIALALNISLLAVYFISRWIFEKRHGVLAVIGLLMSWFTMTVYQSFIGVHIMLAIAYTFFYLFNRSLQNEGILAKELLGIVLKQIAAFLIAVIFYYVTSYLVKMIAAFGVNAYTESLKEMNSLLQIIYNVYYNLKINFFSSRISGSGNIKYVVLAFLLSQISLCFYPGVKNKGWLVAAAVLLVFSPFALTVIRAGIMLRALTAFPIMIGLCGFFTIVVVSLWMDSSKNIDAKKGVMAILITLTILVNYSYIYNVNLSSYSAHVRYVRDENLARMIGDDIIDLTGDDAPDKPVVLIGKYQIKEMENGLTQGFGGSVFNYDIEYIRGVQLMNYLGYKFKSATYELYEANRARSADMPLWPENGSIVAYDDAIVVKLSEVRLP